MPERAEMKLAKGEFYQDPEKYAAMSVPYKSLSEASKAIDRFHSAVRALREKHRIAEVTCLVAVYVEDLEDKENGQVKGYSSVTQFGNLFESYEQAKAYVVSTAQRMADHLSEYNRRQKEEADSQPSVPAAGQE